MSSEKIRLLGLRISVYTRIARLVPGEKKADYDLEETDIFADGGPPANYHALPGLDCFIKTPEGGDMLESYPKLRQWNAAMQSRPTVQASASDEL